MDDLTFSKNLLDSKFVNKLITAFNNATNKEILVINPNTRALDTQKIKEYLNSFENSEDQKFAEDVITSTQYFNWDTLVSLLQESFDKFKENIGERPFYLYLNSKKFASNEIFIAILWKQIYKLNFNGFISTIAVVPDNSEILYIDDAVYTGGNLTNKLLITSDYFNPQKKLIYHIVIPIVSASGYSRIELERIENTPTVKYQWYFVKGAPKLKHQHTEETYKRFKSTIKAVPMFFDHKMAVYESTFVEIYLCGLIPNNKKFGRLIKDLPDIDLKQRIYDKFFVGLFNPPVPY